MDMKDEALRYQEAGFSVIPVKQNKKPHISWKVYQERRATEAELVSWWKTWPGANIGLVCGKVSGITVIDCDSDEAVRTVDELLPDSFLCPVASTPRGGRHYYFLYQPEIKTATMILPGVDIRNDGGYVVAPPSITPLGRYEWIRPWEI